MANEIRIQLPWRVTGVTKDIAGDHCIEISDGTNRKFEIVKAAQIAEKGLKRVSVGDIWTI